MQSAVADAVGISVIIITGIALVIGETTPLFSWIKGDHKGVEFVCRYIGGPFYPIIRPFLPNPGASWITLNLFALAVGFISAFFYAIIAYYITRTIRRAQGKKW